MIAAEGIEEQMKIIRDHRRMLLQCRKDYVEESLFEQQRMPLGADIQQIRYVEQCASDLPMEMAQHHALPTSRFAGENADGSNFQAVRKH